MITFMLNLVLGSLRHRLQQADKGCKCLRGRTHTHTHTHARQRVQVRACAPLSVREGSMGKVRENGVCTVTDHAHRH